MERYNALKSKVNQMAENEMFEANRLYCEQFNTSMSEMAFYKALGRLVRANYLIKISKGLYARPENSNYGTVPPTEEEIVANFIEGGKGIIIGYQLYNMLDISTQISKKIMVYSNAIKQVTKNIGNICIERKELEFDKEKKKVVEILEVISHFKTIQDLNYSRFINLCENFYKQYNDAVTKEVLSHIHYSKCSIAFLSSILNHYGVKNTLNEIISVFSTYDYPSMEKIYELAKL